MTPRDAVRKIERLGAAWHVGLAAAYLIAAAFHLWSAWEHGRDGFDDGPLVRQ